MDNQGSRVCPVGIANILDNRIRRWLQNPRKILSPFVSEGMTVLDIGCGPGSFSIELAMMVGRTGKGNRSRFAGGDAAEAWRQDRGTELEGEDSAGEVRK